MANNSHIDEAKRDAGGVLRYRLVMWIFILSSIAYLDRTNVSIAGVEIGRQLGISNIRLGWVFSSFLIGYAAFQIPGGVLARALGPRRTLLFALIWWAMFTSLTAAVPAQFAHATSLLIVIRFGLGAGEAVFYPASNQFVERWFPRKERGRANGIIFAGVGLGAGITPPLITAIMIPYGWRAPFWLCAGLGIFAGIVWYTIARDEPEHHRSIKGTELAYIVRGRDAAQSIHDIPGEDKKETIPWVRIVTSREALLLTTSYFAFCYMTWIFFGWFYIYLVQVRGLDQRSSSVYTSFPFVAMTLGCLSGGVLGDAIVRRWNLRAGRCWLSLGCMAISSALLVLAADAPSGQEASIISAASMGILYMCANCFWSTVNDIAGRLSSVVSALMNMGGQIGGAVAASVTPLVAKNHGWAASFVLAGAIGGLGAMLWVGVDPRSNLRGKSCRHLLWTRRKDAVRISRIL